MPAGGRYVACGGTSPLGCQGPLSLCVLTCPLLGAHGETGERTPGRRFFFCLWFFLFFGPSLLTRVPVLLDRCPVWRASFSLNYFPKGIVPKYSHIGKQRFNVNWGEI